jgi:hypothetical protein
VGLNFVELAEQAEQGSTLVAESSSTRAKRYAGTRYLEVSSGCSWKMTVIDGG